MTRFIHQIKRNNVHEDFHAIAKNVFSRGHMYKADGNETQIADFWQQMSKCDDLAMLAIDKKSMSHINSYTEIKFVDKKIEVLCDGGTIVRSGDVCMMGTYALPFTGKVYPTIAICFDPVEGEDNPASENYIPWYRIGVLFMPKALVTPEMLKWQFR